MIPRLFFGHCSCWGGLSQLISQQVSTRSDRQGLHKAAVAAKKLTSFVLYGTRLAMGMGMGCHGCCIGTGSGTGDAGPPEPAGDTGGAGFLKDQGLS